MGRIPRLSLDVLKFLDDSAERPLLSSVSLWELSVLVEAGGIDLTPGIDQWLEKAAHPSSVTLAQITPAVTRELFRFPKSFSRDPADRIIIATARALGIPLLTYDKRIRKSGLVNLWK